VCAVCRTDLHIVEGDLPMRKSPVIPGHQAVGTIDQIGQSVAAWRIGDRVGVAWLQGVDGTCRFCQRGEENLCPDSTYTGHHVDGGYAEHVVAPADFVYALPEAMDDVAVSPLLCAGLIGYRALNRAACPEGGKLLMVGFGSSAHIIAPVAVHRGLELYVASRTEAHRKLARDLGAVWAGDLDEVPKRMDAAVFFAPVGKLIPAVMSSLDRGGRCSIAGIHLTPIPEMDYPEHLYWEKEIVSVAANTRDDARNLLREAVAAGVTPTTHVYDLDDANRALADMKHSRIDGTAVLRIA
jgi:propanol-preferring alcohol dehydrogenase